jgi:hypothetical protein
VYSRDFWGRTRRVNSTPYFANIIMELTHLSIVSQRLTIIPALE